MSNKTTGETLGLFYKELIESGIPEEASCEIVRDAARDTIANFGYTVREETENV